MRTDDFTAPPSLTNSSAQHANPGTAGHPLQEIGSAGVDQGVALLRLQAALIQEERASPSVFWRNHMAGVSMSQFLERHLVFW